MNYQRLKNFYNEIMGDFEENTRPIFFSIGSIVWIREGIFLVAEKLPNNIYSVFPVVPSKEFASEGDIIFLPPSYLLPIASRWTILTGYKLTLPAGMIKRGYNCGTVDEAIIDTALKLNKSKEAVRDKGLEDIFSEHIYITNYLLNTNERWLSYKAASDRQVLEIEGVVLMVSPEKVQLLPTSEEGVIIKLYYEDILFDIIHMQGKPVVIDLNHIDVEDFKKKIKLEVFHGVEPDNSRGSNQ